MRQTESALRSIRLQPGVLSRLAVLGLCCLLWACSTTSPARQPDQSADELELANLQKLAGESPEKCLESLFLLAEDDPRVTAAEQADLLRTAFGQLKVQMDSAIAAKDWQTALRLYASQKAAYAAITARPQFSTVTGIRAPEDSIEERIFLAQAQEFDAKGLYTPAMYYYRKLSAGGATSAELILAWAKKAAEQGDAGSFGALAAYLSPEAAAQLRADYPATTAKPEISSAVKGVVTVYVDRGLKVESGVGYPDRVVGSAFQIDGAGYYLTNYHVIKSEVDPEYEGYSRLSIRPSDNPGARIPATVVGWDVELDLALIKSEASPYTFHFGAQATPIEGQRVYVIGSPVGLENTVTAGILSAKSRRLMTLGDVLQIDAPVNPGNSGGPLVNADGAVIGVVFAGLAGYQGLNFALPAAWIEEEIPLLFRGGKLEHAWIGAALGQNLDSSLDVIYRVPASRGLKAGDRLLGVDGATVRDVSDAQMKMSRKPLGSLVCLRLLRDGQTFDWLGQTSVRASRPLEGAAKQDTAENLLAGATGMLLQHVSGPRGENGSYKVLQAWPGQAADEAGIVAGDTIRFIRYAIDKSNDSISFDLSIKSTSTGYMERTMRLELTLELPNFI